MKKIGLAMLLVLAILGLMACGKDTQGTGEQDDSTMMQVSTQFGPLSYPAKWKDALVTSETLDGEVLTVDFSARLDEQSYLLFKVMICGEDGDSVGTVKDENGTVRNVFVDVMDLGDLSNLPQEAQDQIYAMQEAVNLLIEDLK